MFTGLVQDLGTVDAIDATQDGVRLTVSSALAGDVATGDSVAVNGVCLTATTHDPQRMSFDVINESLRRSALRRLQVADPVNLELALRADARLGGHIMQGHVDAVGTVSGVREDGFSRVVGIGAGGDVLRYVVEKGSIAVDGISLTVSAIDASGFEVSLIPETLSRTTLGRAAPGDDVNLEVDVMAKYAEKLLAPYEAAR